MPKMNGPELVQVLRERRPHLKVIFMSGYTDRTAPLNSDPETAFIQKPFTPSQLHRKVAEALTKS
jgi:FixJ family two-component response regulator